MMARRLEEADFKVIELFLIQMIKEEKRLSMEALVSKDDVLNILQWNFGCHVSCTSEPRTDAPHRKQNISSFFLLSRITIFAEVLC